eukprot:m.235092 g.235092  ORF g.235092 m.235092 type:complete len:56 (+) comp40123_c0_seq28:1982-2149(+)
MIVLKPLGMLQTCLFFICVYAILFFSTCLHFGEIWTRFCSLKSHHFKQYFFTGFV